VRTNGVNKKLVLA